MHSWIQNTFIMLLFSSINNKSTEIKSYFKFVIFSFTIESSNRIQASNSISPLFHLSLPESTPPPPVFAVSTTCWMANSSHFTKLSIPAPMAFTYDNLNLLVYKLTQSLKEVWVSCCFNPMLTRGKHFYRFTQNYLCFFNEDLSHTFWYWIEHLI